MEEGGAADRTDLSVAEEAAQGHGAQFFPERVGVVVGPAIEVLTPAQTGEQQGSTRFAQTIRPASISGELYSGMLCKTQAASQASLSDPY